MHIAEVVTIAKSLPLLRLNTYKSLILSYSADYRRIFPEKPVIGRIGRSGRKKRVFFGPSRCVFLSGFFLFLYIFLVLVCKVFRTNPFFVFTGEAFSDLSCILLAQL